MTDYIIMAKMQPMFVTGPDVIKTVTRRATKELGGRDPQCEAA
jgi:acetyl-CoA carboxylase carboxyltransferase component